MYLSTHPMEKYGFNPLDSYKEDSECLVGGEIVDLSVRNDKKGNPIKRFAPTTKPEEMEEIILEYLKK